MEITQLNAKFYVLRGKNFERETSTKQIVSVFLLLKDGDYNSLVGLQPFLTFSHRMIFASTRLHEFITLLTVI